MDISFTGRHIEITDDMRAELTRKLDTALRIFQGIVRYVRVIVTKNTYLFELEVIVESRTHKTLTALASDKDYHTAVQQLEEKLEQQMRRLKEKVEDHHKHGRELAPDNA